jgi:cytosine/uracil/thiamine/allantoin permease
MNFLRKLIEVSVMKPSISDPNRTKLGISHKEWVDFFLVMIICFMIVVYKVHKAS